MTNHNRKIKSLCDSVAEHYARIDAGESAFAANLVNATIEELFRFEYPMTRWANGDLIDFATSMHRGAETYQYGQIGSVGGGEPGESGIVADNATDVPEVDLNGEFPVGRIHTVACSFSFSQLDLDKADLQGLFDMAVEKARAAREKHDRDINALIAFGAASHALEGVTNATGITVAPALTGNWATATAAQIVSDFQSAYELMISQTGGVEIPTMAVLSPSLYARLMGLQNSVASDISVLQYMETAYSLTFEKEQTMALADGSASQAMLLCQKDMQRMRAVMPVYMEPTPPQFFGLSTKVILRSRFGGVMIPRPLSILRLDGL